MAAICDASHIWTLCPARKIVPNNQEHSRAICRGHKEYRSIEYIPVLVRSFISSPSNYYLWCCCCSVKIKGGSFGRHTVTLLPQPQLNKAGSVLFYTLSPRSQYGQHKRMYNQSYHTNLLQHLTYLLHRNARQSDAKSSLKAPSTARYLPRFGTCYTSAQHCRRARSSKSSGPSRLSQRTRRFLLRTPSDPSSWIRSVKEARANSSQRILYK